MTADDFYFMIWWKGLSMIGLYLKFHGAMLIGSRPPQSAWKFTGTFLKIAYWQAHSNDYKMHITTHFRVTKQSTIYYYNLAPISFVFSGIYLLDYFFTGTFSDCDSLIGSMVNKALFRAIWCILKIFAEVLQLIDSCDNWRNQNALS